MNAGKFREKKTSFIHGDQRGVESELRDHELGLCGEK